MTFKIIDYIKVFDELLIVKIKWFPSFLDKVLHLYYPTKKPNGLYTYRKVGEIWIITDSEEKGDFVPPEKFFEMIRNNKLKSLKIDK